MDVSTDPNNEHAQLQDTSHRRLQQGRMSGTGVPGERLMTKECSDTVAEDTHRGHAQLSGRGHVTV